MDHKKLNEFDILLINFSVQFTFQNAFDLILFTQIDLLSIIFDEVRTHSPKRVPIGC